MIRIFSSYGPRGASTRVRVYDWLDYLGVTAERHEYLGLASNSIRNLLRHPQRVLGAELEIRRLSIGPGERVIVSREISPLSRGGLERNILEAAGFGVYDFDDALFNTSAKWPKSLWPKERIWKNACASANLVVAGNEYLANAAESLNRNVCVIPSCVDPGTYVQKTFYAMGNFPVAVWVGSPDTERFLKPIEQPLLRMNAKYGLRLMFISDGQQSLGALDSMVDRIQWEPGLANRMLHEADFGLMPLPDTPFTRGKCAYKLLQYAAAGLPVIGSAVGVNTEVLERLSGIVCHSSDDWIDGMTSIIELSVEERKHMGAAAYAGVCANYSFARWADEWKQLVA